jgi:hypothetical protein
VRTRERSEAHRAAEVKLAQSNPGRHGLITATFRIRVRIRVWGRHDCRTRTRGEFARASHTSLNTPAARAFGACVHGVDPPPRFMLKHLISWSNIFTKPWFRLIKKPVVKLMGISLVKATFKSWMK